MKTLLKNCVTHRSVLNILIEDEKIAALEPVSDQKISSYDRMIDIGDALVIPAMIDPHVHVRDLELSYKEDWTSASKAALAGGIATIFDMPNTRPATVDRASLDLKRKAAEKSLVQYKFYLGATSKNIDILNEILKDEPEDIAGIKVFLAASNSNEIIKDRKYLKRIFELAGKFNKIVVVHAELQSCLDIWKVSDLKHNILNHNELRNRMSAIEGTKICIDAAYEIGNKMSLAHISTQEEIECISIFKNSDRIFCELTPHHLLLNSRILSKIGNIGKVNPPLRTAKDNEVLATAVRLGFVDYIGTDHAPHTLAEKLQDYESAPSGFPGLETALPVLLTAVREGTFGLEKMIEITSGRAAEIFELKNTGEIKVGNYADLAVIDRDVKYKIDPQNFLTKAKYSPFAAKEVTGKVLKTFVKGKMYECEKL
ncbi:MAG: hypothetical protein APR54_00260 [Candidatus Cloacimonas sp. SDB]|nr:MAG: hypothetical protein APR54_00260 [Candidatus Cloacimonas sp. SDB]